MVRERWERGREGRSRCTSLTLACTLRDGKEDGMEGEARRSSWRAEQLVSRTEEREARASGRRHDHLKVLAAPAQEQDIESGSEAKVEEGAT